MLLSVAGKTDTFTAGGYMTEPTMHTKRLYAYGVISDSLYDMGADPCSTQWEETVNRALGIMKRHKDCTPERAARLAFLDGQEE
jgi:hypothetical protein